DEGALPGQDELEAGSAGRRAQGGGEQLGEAVPCIAPACGVAFEHGPSPARKFDQAGAIVEQLAKLRRPAWRGRDLARARRAGEGPQAAPRGMDGRERTGDGLGERAVAPG